MKIIKTIIIFFGIVFLILMVSLSLLLLSLRSVKPKDLLENTIEKELGINITIDKLEYSTFLTLIKAEGITIHNPEGFGDKELAYIGAISLVWDPLDMLIRKRPKIYMLALDLQRLNIIKNKEGKFNIRELIPIKEADATRKDEPLISFDVVVLSIGEINYRDDSAFFEKQHKYTIGMRNQLFIGLEDEDELIRLVVYKALENTDVGKLVNLTFKPVISNVSQTVDAAWGATKTAAKSAWEIASLPFNLVFGKAKAQ